MINPPSGASRRRRSRIIGISVFAVLLVAAGAFLINRFLIVHEDVPLYLQQEASQTSKPVPTPLPALTPAPTVSADPAVTPEPTPVLTPEPTPFADDWNYVSKDLEIHIEQVQQGKHVMYVADITLKSGTLFHTAFAEGRFGRNIRQTTTQMAEENGALFAVNGDYYGYRDNGIIIREGLLYRDNPAREMMALYTDGSMEIFDEKEVDANELIEDGVFNTLSFGPALVLDGELADSEKFAKSGIRASNPRTGIGIYEPNHYVVIVADGRSDYSVGMTLDDFAQVFVDLGCTQAYNLDGGGSSTMVFRGRLVNRPQGSTHQRSTSDILYLTGEEPAAEPAEGVPAEPDGN